MRTLVCSEGDVALVPGWVNPALLALVGTVLGFSAAALAAWRRRI